jgi:hypothetical protein
LSWAWAGTSHGRPKHDLAQPPLALHEAIPTIGEDETVILLHNDAVVQGLSEAPFMRDVTRWGGAHDRHRARQRLLHQSSGGGRGLTASVKRRQ